MLTDATTRCTLSQRKLRSKTSAGPTHTSILNYTHRHFCTPRAIGRRANLQLPQQVTKPCHWGLGAIVSQFGRRNASLALLVVVALGSASCGSDTKSSSGSEPSGAPLNLMTVYEGTGPSSSPEVPEGAIAAAKAINADGGIQGRPVKIISCDTKNVASGAAECGRRAVDEGVVAMVGNLGIFSSEFMPLMAQSKIASIGLEPSTADDFSSPASFPIAGGAPVVLAGLAAALAEGGAKHITLARLDIGPAAGLGQFSDAGLKRFNLTVRDVPVPVGAPDMSPYATAALSGGTDAIIVSQAQQDAVNFVLAVRQADPKIPIALIATSLGDVVRAIGSPANGIIEVASDTTALKSAAEKQYEVDMKAAGYSNVTGFRLASYASVELFKKIAENLPKITAPAVFDALQQSSSLDVGLTAPLQFKTSIDGFPRVFNPCLFASRVDGDNLVPITGKFENAFTGKECPTPK